MKIAEKQTRPVSSPSEPMIPASTELPASVNAKVEAYRAANDRTRAYVLRQIITEWANAQPAKR